SGGTLDKPWTYPGTIEPPPTPVFDQPHLSSLLRMWLWVALLGSPHSAFRTALALRSPISAFRFQVSAFQLFPSAPPSSDFSFTLALCPTVLWSVVWWSGS